MQFGQLIDHDIASTPEAKLETSKPGTRDVIALNSSMLIAARSQGKGGKISMKYFSEHIAMTSQVA